MDDNQTNQPIRLHPMLRISTIALLCLPGYLWGPLFFVLMIPAIYVLVAAPLVDLPGGYVDWVRRRLWRSEQGSYYEFNGNSIRIAVDGKGEARAYIEDIAHALRHVTGA